MKMASDDFTGQYLDSRTNANLTPAQIKRQELLAQGQPTQPEPETEPFDFGLDTAKAVASDIGLGVVELPRQALGGFLDATAELAQMLESIVPLGTVEGGEVTEESFLTTDEARSTTGGLIRATTQFLAGFIPATRAIKAGTALKGVPAAMGGGAIADATVFDPQEDRLSNLVQDYPALQNPVTEYLAADPQDTDAEGRFKNALEGLALGGIADAFISSLRTLRAARIAKREQARAEADRETAAKLADIEETKGTGIAVREPEPEAEFIPFEEKVAKETPEFQVGSREADPERAKNINLENVETTEEVEQLIDMVAEADAPRINEARRQVITNEETAKLANDLNMTVDELMQRRRGEAFNAEQAVAARKILIASGENLMRLAKKAETGSDEDLALFRRAMAQHGAIQAQVSGLTAEAGRALQSFRIVAASEAAQTKAINDALQASGGVTFNRTMAKKIAELDDPAQVNATVKGLLGARTKDMMYEAWINGLLSSPATHTVNVLSNSIVAAWSVGEKKVASLISRAAGDQGVPQGEASAQLKGMVEGAKDGFRLAWHAIKTGEPSDPLQKIENIEYRAITGENLGLSGVPGQFADYMGEFVRFPGRMLTAGDELFKAIGYRMELNAQAYRTAVNEGLEGPAIAPRMTQIINNPPENLHLQAVDASRYQTFTKELGESGKAFQSWVGRTPGARVIVPFIRTPTNIIKYVGERTPLAPIAPTVREEFAAGGARRDLQLARIATGSMAMAAAADWTMSGDITGGGPVNPDMKNVLRATGWQPYSIKVGDEYLAYNRLDPIGAFVGMAADITEVIGQTETEADAVDLAIAGVIAVSKNVASKTYLSGLSEFFNVMSSTSADPESPNKAAVRWTERLAGSVIPAGVAQAERMTDPTLSATQGILEKIQSRIPGYASDLPPRRNIFGEPVVLSGGLGPDIMSPIYISRDANDPIADEIVKQRTLLRMPLKTIQGVELTTEQYDRYIRFYSGEDNRFMDMPLKARLEQTFRNPQYQRATDGQEGGKSAMIRAIFEGYRESAKALMIEEYPELRMSIQKLQADKAEKMTGMRPGGF